MFKKYNLLGILGFIVAIYGIISAIYLKNIFWYSYFVIGGTFFLSYLNYNLNNDSLIRRFKKNRLKEVKNYIYFIIIALIIESIGRYILNLWSYPAYDTLDMIINVFIVGYPFAFFLIYESFILLNNKFTFYTSILFCSILNTFLHEIPNNFAHEWVYNIPKISLEILSVNILVILGWVFLVLIPLLVNNKINIVIKNNR